MWAVEMPKDKTHALRCQILRDSIHSLLLTPSDFVGL